MSKPKQKPKFYRIRYERRIAFETHWHKTALCFDTITSAKRCAKICESTTLTKYRNVRIFAVYEVEREVKP